jgi:hypothetical protein
MIKMFLFIAKFPKLSNKIFKKLLFIVEQNLEIIVAPLRRNL